MRTITYIEAKKLVKNRLEKEDMVIFEEILIDMLQSSTAKRRPPVSQIRVLEVLFNMIKDTGYLKRVTSNSIAEEYSKHFPEEVATKKFSSILQMIRRTLEKLEENGYIEKYKEDNYDIQTGIDKRSNYKNKACYNIMLTEKFYKHNGFDSEYRPFTDEEVEDIRKDISSDIHPTINVKTEKLSTKIPVVIEEKCIEKNSDNEITSVTVKEHETGKIVDTKYTVEETDNDMKSEDKTSDLENINAIQNSHRRGVSRVVSRETTKENKTKTSNETSKELWGSALDAANADQGEGGDGLKDFDVVAIRNRKNRSKHLSISPNNKPKKTEKDMLNEAYQEWLDNNSDYEDEDYSYYENNNIPDENESYQSLKSIKYGNW